DKSGERARLGAIASEQDDAGIEIVSGQWGLLQPARPELVDRDIVRARQTSPCKLLDIARIEKHGRSVDPEDPRDPFRFDLDRPAERAPHRNAELVSPHVAESGGDQLITELPAGLAMRSIAVEHQRLAFV